MTGITATYRGRTMRIAVPGGAQLMMWERLGRQFEELAQIPKDQPVDMPKFRKTLDRLQRIVLSMLPDETDKEWIEDSIIDGEIVDKDLLELLNTIGEAIKVRAQGATPNRAARRVKTPAKKAPAKKAASRRKTPA